MGIMGPNLTPLKGTPVQLVDLVVHPRDVAYGP